MSPTLSQPDPATRKLKKAETRKRLKAAAEACFGRLGFSSCSIGDIAKAAGVAHGTFYVHFPSKEALADELLADFNTGLVERLQPILGATASTPLRTTVRSTAEIFLDYWSEHRGFVETYAQRTAAGLTLTELRDGINPPMLQLLRATLAAAAPQLGPHQPSWHLVTHGLLSMWLRIGLQYVLNPAVERHDAVTTLTQMSIGAVGALLAPPQTPEEEDHR